MSRRLFGAAIGVALFGLAVVPATSAPPPSSSLIASTASGAVQGVLNGQTKEWRGVPYAAPPVGSLRWRPPAPVTPWAGTMSATTFSDQCVQPDTNDGVHIFA